MAKASEREPHSAVSAPPSGRGWPISSQVIRTLVAVAATFQFAVAAAEESASRVALERWPEEVVVAFERVQVGEQSVIQGDVTVLFPDSTVASTYGVQSGKTATIQGAVRTEVATKLPSFPWFTPGGRDVLVAPGNSSSLPSGSHGRVTVGSSDGPSAVLSFIGGIHNIVSLQLGRSSRIECMDACELRVLRTVRLDSSASLGPAKDAGVREEDIQVFVAGTDIDEAAAVQLGEAAQIHGNLYAPNGTVILGSAANATGHIIGRTVRLERTARVAAGTSLVAFSTRPSAADQNELSVTVDGGVQRFRLEPQRQVRAEGLFIRHKTSFGLGPADAVVEQDIRGSQEAGLHHRYDQFHHGLPVLGADFIVQETKGLVKSGIGRLVSGLDVDPNPVLSERRALEFALDAVGSVSNGPRVPQATPPSAQGVLAIASAGGSMAPGSFRLVYRFEVRASRTPGGEMIDIDARTGEVVNRFPLSANYTVSGGGDTLHYGYKPFLVNSFTADGQIRFHLRVPDLLAGASGVPGAKGLHTVRALGLNPITGPAPAQGFIYGDYVVEDFVDEDVNFHFNYWPMSSFYVAHTNLPALIYGVSAHWGVQQAVEYWKNAKPNWIGVDGEGKHDIVAVVDCPGLYGEANATWFKPGTLCFGTGDKTMFGLNTIGHEFAHGVFWHATKIAYLGGEQGVLNEGIADLFGYLLEENASDWCGDPDEAVTLYYKDSGADGSCNGGLALCPGEQCDSTGTCSITYPRECKKRNLANPKNTKNPDTYVGTHYVSTASPQCEDDGHCHQNSTIVGHWFYILANGKQGANDWGDVYNVVGIGRAKAEEIAQRTLLRKLGSSPTFLGLREASIQAAEDLFGPPEVAAVTNAWYAVGVGQPYDPRSHSPTKESGVEPWPAVLKWQELDGETDWEMMVSTDPSFDSNVQILAPNASEVQVIGAGGGLPSSYKVMQIAKANLKPATKYYWRVHSRSAEPLKMASGLDLTPRKKKPPLVRPGRGVKALGLGTGTVLVQVPSSADFFLGGWNPWGATQEFETAAKVPVPITPAPQTVVSGLPGFPSLTTPEISESSEIIIASGLYYPWNADFSWNPVLGASRYRITVSESPNRSCGPSNAKKIPFTSSLHTTVQSVAAPKTAGTVKQNIPLKSDRIYYWWLMVYGPDDIPGGCAYGGHPIGFETSSPKVTLVSPTDGSKVSPFQATLTWNKVKGATGYVLQWGKMPVKVFPAGETVDSETESKVVEPGAVGTYYWRVRPKGPLSGDMGAVSATQFVADIELTKPQLVFPDSERWLRYDGSVPFAWSPVLGASGYLLTIQHRDTGEEVAWIDSGFKEAPFPGTNVNVNINVEGVATHTEGYGWMVQAMGPSNLAGASSSVWYYRVGAAKTLITSPQDGDEGVVYAPTIVSWTCPYCPGGTELNYYPGLNCYPAYLTTNPGEVLSNLPATGSQPLNLAPDTDYCVTVIGLNPGGAGVASQWSSVRFRTKQAACKPLQFGSILVKSPGEPVPQTWDRKLKWLEVSPDIKDYQLTAMALGAGDPPPTFPFPEVSAVSVPTLGQVTIGEFSGPAKVFTLPGALPWSKTEFDLTSGYYFGVQVEGRSKGQEGQICPWVVVGSTLFGVDW
jgi:Zn-dependent metalloprotease